MALAASALAVERVHTLSPGTPHETPYFVRSAEPAVPVVMIVAGIHGNERAPPLAADRVRTWPLSRGTLVIVPRANPRALARGTRFTPNERHPDLNRNFPVGPRTDARGEPATALWALLRQVSPDLLLDLHEGWGVHRVTPASMGSSVVFVPNEPVRLISLSLASSLLHRVNSTVTDPNGHFSLLWPGPEGSLARSAAERLAVPSLVLETTRVGQPLELRVAQQLTLVRAALESLGLIDD